MNVSYFNTMDYEKRTLGERGKNEPKTNPIYPCVASGEAGLKPIKANKMPKQTQNEPNLSLRSLWRSRIKANFKGKKHAAAFVDYRPLIGIDSRRQII